MKLFYQRVIAGKLCIFAAGETVFNPSAGWPRHGATCDGFLQGNGLNPLDHSSKGLRGNAIS